MTATQATRLDQKNGAAMPRYDSGGIRTETAGQSGRPTMKLPALELLHRRMRAEGIDRTAFSYRNNLALIDIVFITDETPFALLFGVRGPRPYSFELPVRPGYRVPLLFDAHLRPLMDALGVKPNPASPFKTSLFLQDLNAHVPATPQSRDMPTELLASRVAAANVEEADRKYFIGWMPHRVNSVSAENLEKTRRILGLATAQRCERSNISSKWSADPKERRAVDVPSSRDFE